MDSKFSILPTIRDHYGTLVDQNAPNRPHLPDYFTLIGVPAGIGVWVGLAFKFTDMQSYIGGVAIFTALLFGLVIHIFQLRMQLLSNSQVPRDGSLIDFINQLFYNVNYAVVIGVIATVASMAAAVTADDNGRVNGIWSGIVAALGAHLMLVVFMCIKRIRAAYRQIAQLNRNGFVDN